MIGYFQHDILVVIVAYLPLIGDSDERDHHIPAQADHPFRAKLTRAFRGKLTTTNV